MTEQKRAYMRQWRLQNRGRLREYNRLYKQTGRGRESQRLSAMRHRRRYPEKMRAHNAVRNAIETGRLVRQPCEVCGTVPAEAHHDDYGKPLDVRWLCKIHHEEVE